MIDDILAMTKICSTSPDRKDRPLLVSAPIWDRDILSACVEDVTVSLRNMLKKCSFALDEVQASSIPATARAGAPVRRHVVSAPAVKHTLSTASTSCRSAFLSNAPKMIDNSKLFLSKDGKEQLQGLLENGSFKLRVFIVPVIFTRRGTALDFASDSMETWQQKLYQILRSNYIAKQIWAALMRIEHY